MGSYYIQRLRGLPREMKNCAWVFDMIPMEVSVVFELNWKKAGISLLYAGSEPGAKS